MTVFFRNFFSLHRKENEINALRLARQFIRSRLKKDTPAIAGVISPVKYVTSAVGRCPFPLAIYGEGVADRPGVRSHGLGCEVQIEKKITSEKKLLDTPTDYAYKPPSPTG